MKRSTDRILSTHVGSLARPHDLLEVMREKEHGRPYDPERFTAMVAEAVRDVVRRQAEAGLDVVTDGEQGKVSFLTYVKERLAGFDQVEGETLLPPSWQKEIDDFPEYYHSYMSKYSSSTGRSRRSCPPPARAASAGTTTTPLKSTTWPR
jgi:5-methyltetrahydropteroyltriglutamate--homocysteine methyltransferase